MPGLDGLEQVIGQQQVEHGGFVHHQEIQVERILLVVLEPFQGENSSRRWMVLAGSPGGFGKTLGRPPGGGGQGIAFCAGFPAR